MANYNDFKKSVKAAALRVEELKRVPYAYRPLPEMKQMYNDFLRMLLIEIDDAPDTFKWGKDPVFAKLGEVRRTLGDLMNPKSTAQVIYEVH